MRLGRSAVYLLLLAHTRWEALPSAIPRLPRRACLLGVLLAAQHDDPEKQDCQCRTNDSNKGSIHLPSSFPDKNEFGVSIRNL